MARRLSVILALLIGLVVSIPATTHAVQRWSPAPSQPHGCDPVSWQQLRQELDQELRERYQVAFGRLGFGDRMESFFWAETNNCGDMYIQWHQLNVWMPSAGPSIDPLVMQRQADELYQLHSSLRAASPIRLNIFWDIPNLSQCVWRFSVVWSTDNLGCPAPRPTSSGNFTFIPQASR